MSETFEKTMEEFEEAVDAFIETTDAEKRQFCLDLIDKINDIYNEYGYLSDVHATAAFNKVLEFATRETT